MQVTKKYIKNKFKLYFFLVVVMTIFIFAMSFSRIAIPLGIAYILSLMLQPLKRSLYSVSIKRKTFTILMAISMAILFVYPLVQGINSVSEEAHKIEYYVPKLENYMRLKYKLFKSEVSNRLNYEITSNPVDQLIHYGEESTKTILVYLPMLLFLVKYNLLFELVHLVHFYK